MDFRNDEIKVISDRRFQRERCDDRKYVYALQATEGSNMLKYVQES